MIARFEAYVNDDKVCTAGLGSYGVMTAILTLVERSPEQAKRMQSGGSLEARTAPKLAFHVGGLDSGTTDSDRHAVWAEVEGLTPGDEIRIKILPPGESDPPREVRRGDCCSP